MTRDDVLSPEQFAKAIGFDDPRVFEGEAWADLPWSVVSQRTRYMVWGFYLDWLKARTPQLQAMRRVA